MEKFSVKKPFTVLVGVVMVLLLGFVALSHMQTNLLPDISTPYLMVVTVYPGASPERVESEVSDVMQNALPWVPWRVWTPSPPPRRKTTACC